MSKLVRPSGTPIEAVPGEGVGSSKLVGDVPTLVAFVSQQLWDNGDKRVCGSFSVFYEQGCYKAWLNDKDGHRCAVLAAGSLPLLLVALEAGLMGDKLDWRQERPRGEVRRGK
jgi:hypothetical protein